MYMSRGFAGRCTGTQKQSGVYSSLEEKTHYEYTDPISNNERWVAISSLEKQDDPSNQEWCLFKSASKADHELKAEKWISWWGLNEKSCPSWLVVSVKLLRF